MALHDWAELSGWDGVDQVWMVELLYWIKPRLPAGYRAYIGTTPTFAIGAPSNGKPDVDARYMGRYLEFVPDDIEQRAHLATILSYEEVTVTSGAVRRAEFVINQVLAWDPKRHDLRQALCRLALATRRLAVRSGPRALLGRVATVRSVPAPLGQVQLDGTLWRARRSELDEDGMELAEGSPVVVESVDGLTLTVRPAEEWEVR